MTQLIRRSQFITTYGPGSILEGPDGPRIIPTFDRSSLFDGGRRPSQFEIADLRLSQTLLANARIMRLPSNAELLEPDSREIYSTQRFPKWSLCVRHSRLYRKVTNDSIACPACPTARSTADAWAQANHAAIRFVAACPNGHLDDVDWHRLLGHSCRPTYLIWAGAGGALRSVTISCPSCPATQNLGIAYSRDWPCSGHLHERGVQEPCTEPAKIIQRGAANLRVPVLNSALTIPPRSTNLHRLFEIQAILSFILTSSPDTKQKMVAGLRILAGVGQIPQSIVHEVDSQDEETILQVIRDTRTATAPGTVESMLEQEYEALVEAAVRGAPPVPSPTPGSPDQFEVNLSDVRSIRLASGRTLRVTPVSRLRVVMVQRGYTRMDGAANIVDVSFTENHVRWYPGVELFGEGIFVDFPASVGDRPTHFPMNGPEFSSWMTEWHANAALDADMRKRLHPVFVWWHTFSHRLMSALSIDSGYSSAAVRERVYLSVDAASGRTSGGVLLYTTQPGGDGTLGGLISLVPVFEGVLAAAFRNLDSCSNDPLCSEEVFAPGKVNGAACYACALVSETSCEFRNMRLDRNLLLRNLP